LSRDNNMIVKIIKATKKDAKTLAGFENDFSSSQKVFVKKYFYDFLKLRDEKALKKLMNNKKDLFYLALLDGVLAGYVQFRIDDGKQDGVKVMPRQGFIRSLYVEKKYRKNGIAKALFLCSMKYFKQRRVKYVSLNVMHTNFARDIYKKWGFEDFRMLMKKKI